MKMLGGGAPDDALCTGDDDGLCFGTHVASRPAGDTEEFRGLVAGDRIG
jgi:hypothetical protein